MDRTDKMPRQVRSRGISIEYLILMALTEGNRIKPTQYNVRQLPDLKWTIEEWYTFLKFNEELLTALFQTGFCASLHERSRCLAEWMLGPDGTIRPIVLMDGHGRTVFCLISALLDLGVSFEAMINKIIVIELDEWVHEWHTKFLPEGVISIRDDIFHIMNDIMYGGITIGPTESPNDFCWIPGSHEGVVTLNCPSEIVLYANFCGILQEESNLHNLRKYMFDWMKETLTPSAMLSFSVVRGAGEGRVKVLHDELSGNFPQIDLERKDEFVSFVMFSEQYALSIADI